MKKLHYLLLSVLSLVLIPGMASAQDVEPIRAAEPTSLLLIIAGLFGIFGFRWIFKK